MPSRDGGQRGGRCRVHQTISLHEALHMSRSAPDLEELVVQLDEIIASVSDAGLRETVALLKIARLDLALRAYDFSEEEFDVALYKLRKNLAVAENAGKSKRNLEESGLGHC